MFERAAHVCRSPKIDPHQSLDVGPIVGFAPPLRRVVASECGDVVGKVIDVEAAVRMNSGGVVWRRRVTAAPKDGGALLNLDSLPREELLADRAVDFTLVDRALCVPVVDRTDVRQKHKAVPREEFSLGATFRRLQ